MVLLLLNEHGDPSFLFPNLSSYNIDSQLAKFEKNLRVVLFQWNDLNNTDKITAKWIRNIS